MESSSFYETIDIELNCFSMHGISYVFGICGSPFTDSMHVIDCEYVKYSPKMFDKQKSLKLFDSVQLKSNGRSNNVTNYFHIMCICIIVWLALFILSFNREGQKHAWYMYVLDAMCTVPTLELVHHKEKPKTCCS